MNSSKSITTSTKNENVSKLITAMEGWNESLKAFSEAPDGVFGSIAIIKCGDVKIRSDELDVEFTVPFDDDMEANEAEIIIYNLSKTTLSKLKNNSTITIEAGYKGDTGVIFKGYIDKKTTSYDGVDKKTTLKCLDRVKTRSLKDIPFKKGTKASAILKDLINRTGTPVAVFKVRRDHTYKDEVKVDGDLLENIKKYAEVCGISVYVNKGKIYARHLKVGDNINFTVQTDTGMIGSPEPFEEEQTAEDFKEIVKGYKISMLLQHRITTAAIVNVTSRVTKGKYRVRNGKHIFNESEAVTEIEVI